MKTEKKYWEHEKYQEYEEYLENYQETYKAELENPMSYPKWERACRMLAKYYRAIDNRHKKAMELDPPYDPTDNPRMKNLAEMHWKKADKLMSVVKKYEELLLI